MLILILFIDSLKYKVKVSIRNKFHIRYDTYKEPTGESMEFSMEVCDADRTSSLSSNRL